MSSAALSVFIRSVGVHAPERKLTNDDLSKIVDTNDEWIKTRRSEDPKSELQSHHDLLFPLSL